jgi:hypothetical protein
MQTSGWLRIPAVEGYNYLHSAFGYAGLVVLASFPEPILEDSHGLARDTFASGGDCAC